MGYTFKATTNFYYLINTKSSKSGLKLVLSEHDIQIKIQIKIQLKDRQVILTSRYGLRLDTVLGKRFDLGYSSGTSQKTPALVILKTLSRKDWSIMVEMTCFAFDFTGRMMTIDAYCHFEIGLKKT